MTGGDAKNSEVSNRSIAAVGNAFWIPRFRRKL
jgi:hypothetical protein